MRLFVNANEIRSKAVLTPTVRKTVPKMRFLTRVVVLAMLMLLVYLVAKRQQRWETAKDDGDNTDKVTWHGQEHQVEGEGTPEFVLFRSIGNDLPPRHEVGQSYRNVEFILEKEEDLPGLKKYWLLNRIVNKTEEARIMALLDRHKQVYLRDPFDILDYAAMPFRFEDFSLPDVIRHPEFLGWKEKKREELVDHMYHYKNRYTMHNNEARNIMLKMGIELGARWILPFDGNCFLTPKAWYNMTNTIRKKGGSTKYFYVPMERLTESNDVLFDPNFKPKLEDEPQLVFRNDARERFNPDMRYGRRSKVEMLWRLEVPGIWDDWGQGHPWELPLVTWQVSHDTGGRGSVPAAGWVARLFSGKPALETHLINRGIDRVQAVRLLLDQSDVNIAKEIYGFNDMTMLMWDADALEMDAVRCAEEIPAAMEYCAAVQSAGDRAVDNGSEESVFARVGILALSHRLNRKPDHAHAASRFVVEWLKTDQQKEKEEQVLQSQSIPFFLDALRLLKQAGALTTTDYDAMVAWFRQFLDAGLLGVGSKLPREAVDTTINGLYYDIQVTAISAFVGNYVEYLHVTQRSKLRLLAHFDPKGSLTPYAAGRRGPAPDDPAFDFTLLDAWASMARMTVHSGVGLWEFRRHQDPVPVLKRAIQTALAATTPERAQQAWRSYHAALAAYGSLSCPKETCLSIPPRHLPLRTPLALMWPVALWTPEPETLRA
eukprot:comp21377_c0_seq1/m.29397 comp21377_c0_seq1/g.29397  ORF comp21377_c0_seq1/g.29397 comp21377_c0_seq1/m.29397 type:complete len:714 (-) comp21377_c0_seq1:24-2165(-)